MTFRQTVCSFATRWCGDEEFLAFGFPRSEGGKLCKEGCYVAIESVDVNRKVFRCGLFVSTSLFFAIVLCAMTEGISSGQSSESLVFQIGFDSRLQKRRPPGCCGGRSSTCMRFVGL